MQTAFHLVGNYLPGRVNLLQEILSCGMLAFTHFPVLEQASARGSDTALVSKNDCVNFLAQKYKSTGWKSDAYRKMILFSHSRRGIQTFIVITYYWSLFSLAFSQYLIFFLTLQKSVAWILALVKV